MTSNYPFLMGQGPVSIDEINPDTGLPLNKSLFLGNVPNDGLTINFDSESVKRQDTTTGKRLTAIELEINLGISGTLQLENFAVPVLNKVLYGETTTIAGATITDEEHTVQKGYKFMLRHFNITEVTSITNEAGSTTYVEGTDYTVDLNTGLVAVLSSGAIVDNSIVQVNYTTGAAKSVSAFSKTNQNYWLTFRGVNNADVDSPFGVEIFNCRLKPPKDLKVIAADMTSVSVEFMGLWQPLLTNVAAYKGGFFRWLTV